ncbi:MAG: sodium:solute symporter [Prevotella sp.]|nr:sodium:solute symporter [Prevotella sp.]
MLILVTILAYFCILLLLSRFTSRRTDNDTFYRGNRRSPWYLVAFGMIGASISGVTFISVPGWVMGTGMTYMQTCIGFIFGYLAVAFILLPVYYKFKLTTIYSYLKDRLGQRSYRTGASFFLLSKMTGAAARFYVVCMIMQRFVLDGLGVPFPFTVVVMVLLIWLYTRRSGIRTLVWTDTLQTLCMFAALILIIIQVADALDMSIGDAVRAVAADEHSRMFVFDDWVSKQNFWKQFFSGVFIVIVMTGLDQDMMQKNLTCRSLRDAQKDMCSYGLAFVPANLLFLGLGVLLVILAQRQGIALPEAGDDLLPMFAATGQLGKSVVVLFTLGIVAAAFSSADSALTSLTTSYCVDIQQKPDDEGLRRRAHLWMSVVFVLFVLLFRLVNSSSIIDAIYVMCGYTYGPLLGMFAYSLLTRRTVNDRIVPYIAVASPLLCFAIDTLTASLTGYRFGYELLMLNGLLTFAGLWLSGMKNQQQLK